MSQLDDSLEREPRPPELIEQPLPTIEGLSERLARFVENIQQGNLVDAIAEVKSTIEEIIKTFEKPGEVLAAEFKRVTGITLDTSLVDAVSQGLREVGRFVEHGVRGLLDIPKEKWLPIAGDLIVTGAAFACGDFVTGTVFAIRTVQGLLALENERPELVSDYHMKDPVKQLQVSEQFQHQAQQEQAKRLTQGE